MSKRVAVLLCAVAMPAIAAPAVAQTAVRSSDTEQAATRSDETEGGLPDVIVTARRRAESAQKVPAALSVVGGDLIDQSYTVNTQELTTLIPSLKARHDLQHRRDARIAGDLRSSGQAILVRPVALQGASVIQRAKG